MRRNAQPARPNAAPYGGNAMLHRIITSLLVLSAVALSCRAEAAEVQRVRLLINGSELTAELADGAAARDFQALLPLRLPLQDFNSTEKISDLPERLSTSGEPEGFEPVRGDLAYYAPWGNLAIFYRDYSWSRSLVKLGHITSGNMEALSSVGNGDTLVIERAD